MKDIEEVKTSNNMTAPEIKKDASEVKPLYRKPLYRIIGKIIKKGAGWIQVEECFSSYIWHTKNKDTGETESFEEFPFRVLICFSHDLGQRIEEKGGWTNLDKVKVFTVRTTVDMNRSTKRMEVKNWLETLETFEDFNKWTARELKDYKDRGDA